jgi:branched-chain amino acid transport system permease protein
MVFWKVPILGTFLITLVLLSLFSVSIGYVVTKPLSKVSMGWIFAILGVGIIIRNLVMLIFGTQPINYPNIFSEKAIRFAGANIYSREIYLILTSIVILTGFDLLLKKSKIGSALRATAYNAPAAECVGINSSFMVMLCWALAGGLAAISSGLLAQEIFLTPEIGLVFTFKALTAAFIGGIGNPRGAIIGGLMIGIIENFSIMILPSGFRDIITFSILLFVFSIKPTGILGEKIIEKV